MALLVSSPACLCCAILGCGMISRGAPSYLVAARPVLRSEPNETRLVCSGQCATSQSRPRSCCVQGQVVGCKVAAEALTGPEETRRSDPGAIRPNSQPARPAILTRTPGVSKRDCPHKYASGPTRQLFACHLSICCRCLQVVASKQGIHAQPCVGPGSCWVQLETRCTRLNHVQQSRPQHEKKQFRAREAARPTARR